MKNMSVICHQTTIQGFFVKFIYIKRCILSLLFIVCFIFLSCADNSQNADSKIMLADQWRLQSSAKVRENGQILSSPGVKTQSWYPVTVPTTVLAALVDNGVYPDPYYGDNLKSIPGYRDGRWLAMKADSPFYPSWWYRTEFDLPLSWKQKKIVLHFDGINYKVNIWLNGQQIADT